MKALALRFPGAVLVFATMKRADELSKSEIDGIGSLAEWGREYVEERQQTRAPVIVLTGAELFAPFSLREASKGMGGRNAKVLGAAWVRTDDLRVLADLTQQLYLNMPSYGAWLEAKWRSRGAEPEHPAAT